MHKLTTADLVAQKLSLEEFQKLPKTPISIVLDNVRSLQNVGLLFRLCDAIRAEKLYLAGITGHPPLESEDIRHGIKEHAFNQITKTAIHTVDYMPWEHSPNTVALLKTLKAQGKQIIIAEQTDQSKDFREIEYKKPVVLVFGHERLGVADEVLELADEIVHIPMLGMGNSHNIAVSAAIICYQVLGRVLPQ